MGPKEQNNRVQNQEQPPQTASTSQPEPTENRNRPISSTPSSNPAHSAWGGMPASSASTQQTASHSYPYPSITSPPPTYGYHPSYGSPPPAYSSLTQAQTHGFPPVSYHPYGSYPSPYGQQQWATSSNPARQPLSNPNIASFEAANEPCHWGCGVCGKKREARGYAWCWYCNDNTSGALYSGTGNN
ncbi:hypothetical protein V865_002101 [Kwoniella europaea PYCC6329]|uniref:RanBP2-type domain-containing protein n=1 Tax=Kwoniella europaea PYCC6329 TaxID=1423913 RepID=A0AAX4KE32_9TREE